MSKDDENTNSTSNQGQTRIASRIRAYFNQALDKLEKRGLPFDEIIQEELQRDFKGTITALAKFIPMEIKGESEVTHRHVVEMTDDQLIDHINRTSGARITQQKASKKKPKGVH